LPRLAQPSKRPAGVLSITKTGIGQWVLSGANTYTGASTVTEGTLALVGGSQTSAITVSSGSLGFTPGSPVTSTSAVDLSAGTVTITGTTGAPNYLLMTATSFTGPFVLSSPVPGYQLVMANSGTELRLNQVAAGGYDTWKTQITNGLNLRTDDADGDGFTNLQEFLFGSSPIANTESLVTTTSSGGTLVLRWLQRETGSTYTPKESSTLGLGS
jgi:autotransporter-associated beta strand protein